jgi:hypothetical protein
MLLSKVRLKSNLKYARYFLDDGDGDSTPTGGSGRAPRKGGNALNFDIESYKFSDEEKRKWRCVFF